MKKNNGFTLAEVMMVIIILGALVSLAVPRYTTVLEKTRSAEGVQILEALRKAQWTYFYENNSAYTDAIAGLDVDVGAMNSFDNLVLTTAAASIASVRRIGGAYTLTIGADGTITCAGAICGKLGF